MEIKDMKMEDIQKRMSEIKKELEGECDVDALTKEFEQLEARANEIKAEAEKRQSLMNKVSSGMVGKVIETKKPEEPKMSEEEVRANEFVKTGHLEMRALLSTGTIAKPTKVGGIADLPATAADIVDDVNAISLTGNGAWVAAYKTKDAVAAEVTDGSAIGGTASEYNYVTINPAEWGILDEISKQVKKMTPLDYQSAIENSAVVALRNYASNQIVTAIKASALAEAKTVAIDADYLRTLVLGFRAVQGKGAVKLYLSQADLLKLGKVRGTNEKRPLYEISFDNGTTTSGTITEGGLAVQFRVLDQLAEGTQLFGQPGAVDLPMWDNYTIETDEGGDYFKRNMIGVKGLQTANADLVAYHAMQIVTQETA